MRQSLIQITKRQLIDATTTGQPFQTLFNDTHSEFVQQMNSYQGITTWNQLISRLPQNAIAQFNIVMRPAAQRSINALSGVIPNLTNTFSQIHIPFANWSLEIIDSDTTNVANHKVFIYYHSEKLTMIDSIHNKLLLSLGDRRSDLNANIEAPTFMLEISRPDIEISKYEL